MYILKNFSLVVLTLLVSFTTIAQINFEKGYIITENDQRLEVYIKNQDWKYNPTVITYRQDLESQNIDISIHELKEFGIKDISKYVKFHVDIDTSPVSLKNLGADKRPHFEKRTLLLKVLVEGNARLYKYENGNDRKYFFETNEKEIEQLVYKEYRVENYIKSNNNYKQQLFNHLKCEGISRSKIERVDYDEQDLTEIFRTYNSCKDPNYEQQFKKAKKGKFQLNIRPGINLTSLKSFIQNSPGYILEFDTKISWRIGIESEFILPFNNNKWSLLGEVSYQEYKNEYDNTGASNDPFAPSSKQEIDYSYLDIAVGARYYLFLNDENKIFVNLAYVPNITINKKHGPLEISKAANFAAGIGYKYSDKYAAEIRYGFNRNILNRYIYHYSEYNTLSFILSYTLF